MKRLFLIGIVGSMLILSVVRTGFPVEGHPTEPTPQSLTLRSKGWVSYDLAELIADLAELTNWPVADWPAPQILQAPSEAFQGWTQLNRRSYFGQYDPERNRIFLNLRCISKFPEHPGAYCIAVLFHELVHWGQYHSGMEEYVSGSERELHATDYEKRYVEARLGIEDMFQPDRPTPDQLPPLGMPIRLKGPARRVIVQDVAGQRQGLWVITGTWIEARAMKRYQVQIIHHREHWVGVRIFQIDPVTGGRLVEGWWDQGYIPSQRGVGPDITFPVDPVYRARWVRVR